MNIIQRFQTAKRGYYLFSLPNGGYRIDYRPLNPSTGAPWQASRSVPGWDAYLRGDYGSGSSNATLVIGPVPDAIVRQAEGNNVCYYRVFSTIEVALAALRKFDKLVIL